MKQHVNIILVTWVFFYEIKASITFQMHNLAYNLHVWAVSLYRISVTCLPDLWPRFWSIKPLCVVPGSYFGNNGDATQRIDQVIGTDIVTPSVVSGELCWWHKNHPYCEKDMCNSAERGLNCSGGASIFHSFTSSRIDESLYVPLFCSAHCCARLRGLVSPE